MTIQNSWDPDPIKQKKRLLSYFTSLVYAFTQYGTVLEQIKGEIIVFKQTLTVSVSGIVLGEFPDRDKGFGSATLDMKRTVVISDSVF